MSDDAATDKDGLWASTTPAGEPPAQPGEELARPPSAVAGNGVKVESEVEAEIWAGRTHWKHYAGRLLLWIVANAILAILIAWVATQADWLGGGGAFWIILAVLLLSGLIVVGGILAAVLGTRYRLTSQRLFIERGLLSQTVDQTELIRVDDVRLRRSMLDRVFGLGSVAVLSTDATDSETVIQGIAEPESVAESIRTRMRVMRKKSLFVEKL